MPKVTDAHRASRREQIMTAALGCFAAKGIQRTSMADIIAASGLSAGAIYLQFEGKQQIALAVGEQVLSRRLGEFGDLSQDGRVDPIEAMHTLLDAMIEDLPDTRVLLQLWGEATADPEMAGMVAVIFARLQDAWMGYLRSWAQHNGAGDPAAWARSALPAVIALAQGFLVQRTLLPDFSADAYFRSVRAVAGPALLDPTRSPIVGA